MGCFSCEEAGKIQSKMLLHQYIQNIPALVRNKIFSSILICAHLQVLQTSDMGN